MVERPEFKESVGFESRSLLDRKRGQWSIDNDGG